jgi:hypothetical protein
MKRMQRGMTMIGFLITLAVVIFFVYCGMKIVPMYIEYYSVKKALSTIAAESGIGSESKEKIRTMFMRRLDMSYALTVKKLDPLKIESTDNGYNLVVDYERREPLVANLDVVGKFHAEQALVGGARQ